MALTKDVCLRLLSIVYKLFLRLKFLLNFTFLARKSGTFLCVTLYISSKIHATVMFISLATRFTVFTQQGTMSHGGTANTGWRKAKWNMCTLR